MQPFGAGSQDYASRCQQRIVIIGAGFSGTALAILLLQRAGSRSTHVVLIGREREPGRGAAYGAHRYPWLLNVPAGHMSAFQDRPDDFVEFARNRLPAVTAEDFLPRSLYGEYLQARLSEAVTQARDHVQLTFCQGEVARVARLHGSASWRVELGDGRTLLADDVVLALGNPPPRLPPELADIANSERYVHCPWSDPPKSSWPGPVLILGSGLTMADVALRLASISVAPELHALSRHGLLPAAQTIFRRNLRSADVAGLIAPHSISLRDRLRLLRRLADSSGETGGDWRELIGALRPHIPELWRCLSDEERRRFLRHARSYWDVHRHRLAPAVARDLQRLRTSGALQVHAGRIEHARTVAGGILITWRSRGQGAATELLVRQLVNATGSDYSIVRSNDPLIRSLLRDRLIAADSLGLGLRTHTHGAVIGADGATVPRLYYVGPMLRERDWEATAVPELRGLVEQLAVRLAATQSVYEPAVRGAPPELRWGARDAADTF